MPIVAGLHAVLPRLLQVGAEVNVSAAQLDTWRQLLAVLPPLPVNGSLTAAATVFAPAALPIPPGLHFNSEIPQMYAVHPFRLATVVRNDTLAAVGRHTYLFGHGTDGNSGWNQPPINAAYLGLADQAHSLVVSRAHTSSGPMRFPAYLPNMQDFRPNEDHLSVMRTALQAMLAQHGDGANRADIALLPAWPCDLWSARFKLHLPLATVIEGTYNHTTHHLALTAITPPSRAANVRVLACAASVSWPAPPATQ